MKKIIKNNLFVSFIMASITYAVICLTSTLKTYDVVSWIIYLILILLFNKTDIFSKEYKKESILFSLFFTYIMIYGLIVYNSIYEKEILCFNKLFSITTLIKSIGIFNLLYIVFKNILPKLYNLNIINNKKYNKSKWVIFISSFFIIILMWIPYFLAFYPGIMSSDSFGDLGTIITHFQNPSDHHPIVHTIYVAIPYNIGYKIFGNMTSALAFSTFFQMITQALIFSSLILFLYNRKVKIHYLIMILLYYSILPMHAYLSLTMWKDVVFSGLLLLLSIQTVKILEFQKNNEINLKKLIPFIIISIFCVFFRNNAIYMYMILAITTIIIFRKKYKTFIIAFIIVFGTYYTVKGPVFNFFNVGKSSSAEYISMPLQQIGRMAYKNVKFTNKEKIIINKVIPINELAKAYNPVIVDSIKFNSNFSIGEFNKNKIKYLGLYLNLVRKHPLVALEAYSISTLGYWYPGVEYWSVEKGLYENNLGLKNESKVPNNIKEFLFNIERRGTPIFNIEWSIGLCFCIIFLFIIITIRKTKSIKYIYPYVPVGGIWITMMIASPVFAEFRYVYGAFTTLPLLLTIPYLIKTKNN